MLFLERVLGPSSGSNIEPILYESHIGSISHYDYDSHIGFLSRHDSIKKWNILLTQIKRRIHFKASYFLTFTVLRLSDFIHFLHLNNFLEIVLYCKNADANYYQRFLWHFDAVFVRLLSTDWVCQKQMTVFFQLVASWLISALRNFRKKRRTCQREVDTLLHALLSLADWETLLESLNL